MLWFRVAAGLYALGILPVFMFCGMALSGDFAVSKSHYQQLRHPYLEAIKTAILWPFYFGVVAAGFRDDINRLLGR
jgi:hypothetical protein